MPRALQALIFLSGLAASLGNSCRDENTKCPEWKKYCSDAKYGGYMDKNCPLTCGKCGGSSCVDNNAQCADWAARGECAKNPGYMNLHCKKSCGKCGGGTGGGSCTDKNTMCPGWANNGECTKNPDYMNKNCAKSCGCGGTTVTDRPVVITGDNQFGCNGGVRRYPSSLPNSHFYQKICYTAQGLKIISTNRVSNKALERTAFLISHVMKNVDPRVPKAMNRNKFRHVVMAAYPAEVTTTFPEYRHLGAFYNERARGLGATTHLPLGSSAEENAMCYRNDRYRGEDITIHEFAHSLHLTGFETVFRGFKREIEGLYRAARSYKTWGPYNHYAYTDYKEYFAEGLQSYFNCNMNDRNAPTDRNQLSQKDPNLYKFLDRYLGRNNWDWRGFC